MYILIFQRAYVQLDVYIYFDSNCKSRANLATAQSANQKAHFLGDICLLFRSDFKLFFEENSEMSLFLLSAIYLHVNKD